MKRLISMPLIGASLILASCGEQGGKKENKAIDITGTWELTGIEITKAAQLGDQTIEVTITFNEDKTCSYTIKGKKVEGTYEFDAEAKTVTIVAGKLKVKTTAHIVTLGSNMSFVFDADKILSVVKTITGVTSGLNKSASAVNKLLEQFDGMMVGFELKKQ